MNNIIQINAAIAEATGIAPTAFTAFNISEVPSITFTAYRQGDNAVTEEWRYSTRVTAESLEEAMQIEEEIADSLTTLGDEEKFSALRIEVNGGGTLEDETTGFPQLLTYYDITVRS